MSLFSKKKLTELKAKETAQKKHTILIVDDEESNRKVMASVLRDFYHVLETEDGVAALELVKSMENPEQISMVISDQRMPNMTGVELFEQLSTIIPKTVRIIVTGFIDVESIIDSVNKAHIYKFILKPFERVDFLWTAKRAVETYEMQKQLDDHLRLLEQKVEASNSELVSKSQELDQAYKKLEQVSLTDQLTGLNNRHFLRQYLQSDVALTLRRFQDWIKSGDAESPENASLVFYLIDVDHFKAINDEYGYAAGDRLLQDVKALLQDVFRTSDYLVRWGGEEFLVVARNANFSDGASICERLRVVFSNHLFKLDDTNTIKKTCSIGFAAYPLLVNQPDKLSWEQVINVADAALYAAKQSGRNAWIGLAADKSAEADTILANINGSPNTLIHSGTLVASSNIGDSINWEK